MTQEQKDVRLAELNQKCRECRDDSVKKGFERPNPKSCADVCLIGREIHKLENPEWGAQDWGSSQLEEYYHN